MTRLNKRLVPFLLASLVSIAAAADKSHPQLTIGPASSYEYKQTSENVTIAADVYEVGDKVKEAFGKHNPYDYGVLPILVVIDNHTGKAIRVGDMKLVYEVRGGEKIEATPAAELKYLLGSKRPNPAAPRLPIPGVSGKPKANPLAEWEIEGRAFSARIIPPNESASGFFYFQTGHRSNSTLYISGLSEVGTGRELLYFEIPLAPVQHTQ